MPNQHPHILIVEDDVALQHAYQRRFKRHGWQTTIAETVLEAQRHISENQPDLILIDVMLPGDQNGFDLLESIRHNPQTEHLPVIMATNLQDQEQDSTELKAVYMVKADHNLQDIFNTAKKLLQI